VEPSSAHVTVEKLRVTVFMCIEQCAIRVVVIGQMLPFVACCTCTIYELLKLS
jgi:hypothetical protein